MSTRIKASYLFLAFIPHIILYLLIQSLITVGQYDFLTVLDTKIPFIPQFIWIYHSLVPVIFLTGILLLKRKDIFFGLIASNIIAGAMLCLFYIFFPSFYPREMFVDNATLSGWLIEMTRAIDGPHNTFPSGHVTFAWLLAFFANLSQYVKRNHWLRVGYFSWATLISISTLTLKQHYILDVVSGLFCAWIIFILTKKMFVKGGTPKLFTIHDEFISSRNTTK